MKSISRLLGRPCGIAVLGLGGLSYGNHEFPAFLGCAKVLTGRPCVFWDSGAYHSRLEYSEMTALTRSLGENRGHIMNDLSHCGMKL